MLYLVGSAITLIPVVGAIGGIISLVALILLIIGWRALGRSSLKESENYRSTGLMISRWRTHKLNHRPQQRRAHQLQMV